MCVVDSRVLTMHVGCTVTPDPFHIVYNSMNYRVLLRMCSQIQMRTPTKSLWGHQRVTCQWKKSRCVVLLYRLYMDEDIKGLFSVLQFAQLRW